MTREHVIIAGAGVYGLTAALELKARGHRVTVLDPGPIPHPLAASTDISKVIRMEYGPDETYMSLMEEACDGWLQWNEEWNAAGHDALYHETGVVMICRAPMSEGGFEFESWQMLRRRGHRPERLNQDIITTRFPAWSTGLYVDGFFHAKGGYAESGRVVAALASKARAMGVAILDDRGVRSLIEENGRVVGVTDQHGERHRADEVVVAAGAWTGALVPALQRSIVATGHPVFHLKPERPDLLLPERFPTFTADVSRTGYYGFPINRDGLVKIANHGLGTRVHPDDPRAVTDDDHRQLRVFLEETFPALLSAEVVFTRLCLYADTQDEDFWIARDPERDGLTVSSGGSGHGFKFAPVLGKLTADAVEGNDNPWLDKFRWRPEVVLRRGLEAARCHDR